MYKTIEELIEARMDIERKIRAIRVVEARRAVHRLKETPRPGKSNIQVFSWLGRLDGLLSKPYHIYSEVDDLLDCIEIELGLDMESGISKEGK